MAKKSMKSWQPLLAPRATTRQFATWCASIGILAGLCLPLPGDDLGNNEAATAARMSEDLAYLASDELAGRGVGSEGIAKAGEFIAERFNELGFNTQAFDDSPYQAFNIPGPTVLGAPAENTLAFMGPQLQAMSASLKLSTDYTPLSLGGSGTFAGPVAFAGYGITASEFDYDDYAGFDPAGKVVIVIRKEPQQSLASSKFDGTQNSQYAYFTSKEVNASLHKVAALLLVNDKATAAADLKQRRLDLTRAESSLSELLERNEPPGGAGRERYETRLRVATQQVELLKQKIAQNGDDALLGLNDAGSALSDQQVPTYFCTRAVANRLLIASGGQTLDELEAAIDRDGTPKSFVLQGVTCTGKVTIDASNTPARNVIAVSPGRGALADEYVVVGAHYDHVGMGGQGSLARGTIAVHNGADDNGSGTVTLLEVARQLAQLPSQNRRTLIFMAFSAEESGLLGSAYYVRNPRWPLEKTVAMINLDMVGRLHDDELTVYGTGTAAEFASQLDRLNQQYGFKMVKVPQGRGASDHASFYEVKIPVYHFFTGLHNDYHRPSDDIDKVNVPGMVRISRLVSDVVREIAEASTRPRVLDIKGSASPRSQIASASRAALGITLEGGPEGAPRIIEARENGPAASAGLRPGDLLVAINGIAVPTVARLRAELAKSKKGDRVDVTFRRESENEKNEGENESESESNSKAPVTPEKGTQTVAVKLGE